MDQIDPGVGAAGQDPDAESARAGSKTFISYASQDAAVADKLCAALEASGFPCWIAPRDLRAGECYAAAIVQATNDGKMLVLVSSKNASKSSHVLREVDRASSKKRPVLVVRMDTAGLPPDLEYFLSANQWLDASSGPLEQILPALVASVRGRDAGKGTLPPSIPSKPSFRLTARALLLALAVVGLGGVLAAKFWLSKRVPQAPVAQVAPATTPSDTAITEKSIAVLPFTDMSEKKDQEYFSDGLSEELIDLLAKGTDMRVAARTSAFYL